MRHARLIVAGALLALAVILGVTAWNLPGTDNGAELVQISREDGGQKGITVSAARTGDEVLSQPGVGPDLSTMKGRVLPFAVTLDTHEGDIGSLDLNGKLFLREGAGVEIPGIVRQLSTASHHTEYVVAFPKLDSRGKALDDPSQERLTLVVRGVGQSAERVLLWELTGRSATPAWVLFLAAGVAAAAGLAVAVSSLRKRSCSHCDPAAGGGGPVATVLMGALALVLAGSWLAVALLAGKAGVREAVATSTNVKASVAQTVTRAGVTETGVKVQATYAPPAYYEQTGRRDLIAQMGADKYLVFIVAEDHYNDSAAAPTPVLLVDGTPVQSQLREQVLIDSEHHRTRVLQFDRVDAQGRPLIVAGESVLELQWPGMKPTHGADHNPVNPLRWTLPIAFAPVHEQAPLSPMIFLTLTVGLFSALSPCLIQLTVYYLSTLAGVSLNPTEPGARGPVLRTALWFVAGVIAAYTAGGALAGLVGQYLAQSGVLFGWNRPVALIAGFIMIGMGIYSGAAARAPMLCKLPLPRLARFAQGKGGFGTMLMGAAIAFGCLQCFGGAVLTSLLAYVGSLGSPLLGASMLFLFSLGIAVPFVLSALAWSRVAPHLAKLEKLAPYLALVSSVIMILLGGLMVADRFHWVSGLMRRLLPFLNA